MAVNRVVEVGLKRTAEDCNEDRTNMKVKKLEEEVASCDDEQSSSHSSESDETNQCTSNSQTTYSQSSMGGAEMQIGISSLWSLLPSPRKNFEELQLEEGKVFEQMMHEFSKLEPPRQMSYGKTKYNLIFAYDEFWKNLFSLPKYTTGSKIKVVNSSLDISTLLAIAKILKRGWEDERFFPKRLAKPFLEACIFNRPSEDELDLEPKVFYKYINEEERKMMEYSGKTTVDEENIKIFQKYYPEPPISIGDTIESACKKVLGKIMFQDVANVCHIWHVELDGLIKFDKFKFLGKKQPNIPIEVEDDVGTIAPHRLWSTFFYKWSHEMKTFYFKLLKNDNFMSCNICGRCFVNAKHIVSTQENDPPCQTAKHMTMLTERHNNILMETIKKVVVAVAEHRGYFTSEKENWKIIVMNENYRKPWPQELAMLNALPLFPHIVLYCSFPKKRALIIALTVPWDHWATYGSIHYCKVEKYSPMVDLLNANGFDAKYFDLKVGARGIWSDDLYNLFYKICGMKRPEITNTMEKISKKIIEVAYEFQYEY